MHIAIIGNGIAGITAARHLRKYSNHQITVISGETEHFFSRTALMYLYMGHMTFAHTKPYEDAFWPKNKIDLVYDWVTEVNTAEQQLSFQSGKSLKYDKLIIASGSTPNYFGWPGQNLEGVQGLYSFQDLEKMEKTSTQGLTHAVIVGGGLIGIEMAEMLHSRNIGVTMLVREPSYWSNVLPKEESELINIEITEHHIALQLKTELKEIKGNAHGKVTSIVTSAGQEIACQLVGLTAGVKPNIAFLAKSGLETDRGILVNEFFESSQPNVYAIGDCAQFRVAPAGRRPIEQVWYTGRMHGETLAYSLCKKKTAYRPGPWFNSAKFFNIEYQTYGEVPATLADTTETYCWMNTAEKKLVRIVFERSTQRFVGLNSFGIRYRHECFNQWLQEGKSVGYVLGNLQKANFDPEFFKQYESEIVSGFQKQFPEIPVAFKAKKGFLQKLGILS